LFSVLLLSLFWGKCNEHCSWFPFPSLFFFSPVVVLDFGFREPPSPCFQYSAPLLTASKTSHQPGIRWTRYTFFFKPGIFGSPPPFLSHLGVFVRVERVSGVFSIAAPRFHLFKRRLLTSPLPLGTLRCGFKCTYRRWTLRPPLSM